MKQQICTVVYNVHVCMYLLKKDNNYLVGQKISTLI